MTGKVLVGTASWTDPGFVADWYPPKLPAAERLHWYAQHFGLVELNSSFYAVPVARQMERWCGEVPRDFVFDVKLHRLLSRHSTALQTLPPDLRKGVKVNGDKVVLTPQLEQAVARRFLEELEPLRASGHLGALLLQLSPSFSPRDHSLEELQGLMEALRGHRVAVELRNRNWATKEQLPETEEFFKRNKTTFVCVDAPREAHFMILPSIDVVTNPELVYLRLHGRNAKGYISGKTVATRFDYKYSDDELAELAQRTATLAKEAGEVHIVFNNNAHDYAPRDASRFRELFAEKFPALAGLLHGPPVAAAARGNPQQTFSFNGD